MSPISSDHVATFRKDGVVCIRGLIPDDWIERLRGMVERALNDVPGNPNARNIAAEAGKAGRFHNESSLWSCRVGFAEFVRFSPIAKAAADLLSSRTIHLYNDHLLVKEPGTDAPTPWHQDATYFRIKGDQIASVWIGLDPVRKETGAMRFVAGSHTWGRMFRPVAFASGTTRESEVFDGQMPDIDGDPQRYETVCYDMKPGDVTFHHALTIHGSLGNASAEERRRGYSVRLAGNDVRYALRPWTSYDIGNGLRDGDRIDGHPDFPLLWPQRATV